MATHDTLTRHADDPAVGASVFTVFDFSTAFDKIAHRRLILKTEEFSLPSSFIRLLADYLTNSSRGFV